MCACVFVCVCVCVCARALENFNEAETPRQDLQLNVSLGDLVCRCFVVKKYINLSWV